MTCAFQKPGLNAGARRWLRGVLGLSWALGVFADAATLDVTKLPLPATRSVDFIADIQPIFAKSCHGCHGPEKQKNGLRLDNKEDALRGGENGAVIVPGKSQESRLIHLVSGLESDKVMPAKGDRLTDEQIGLLRAWIDQGAKWPEGPEIANTNSPIVNPQHWAFRTPIRVAVPSVNNTSWTRNAIDHFILQRLEKAGLVPSPEAERRVLIRRLSLDVLGLPPSPEEVEEFLADRSSDAYPKLVERILTSPRYGERWARHWLDVVRFAESNGFETNTPRNNAWPYRDYVIRAFNDDKPYPQFIVEQLAGDALGADEATGFIVGGAWDEVKSPDINLTLMQRSDELHDMVNAASSAFLGLTVACARCHNHKFDPITQTDYYAMQAVFAGVQHGNRALRTPDQEARQQQAVELRRLIERIDGQLTHFEPFASPALTNGTAIKPPNPRENIENFVPVEAKFVRFTIHETLNHAEPCIDELEIYSAGSSSRNVALASAGAKATASGTYPNNDFHKLEHLNDGKMGNSHSWIANSAGTGWVQIEFPEMVTIDKIVWGRDREEVYKDRLPTIYTIEAGTTPNLLQFVAGRAKLRPPVQPRQNVERFAPVEARLLRFTILATTDLEPCLDELEVYTAEENPRNIALAAAGARAIASSIYPDSEIHKLEHLNDGKIGNSRSWISNERGQGWVQLEFPEKLLINKVVWGRDREAKFSDRLATNYMIEIATTANDWKLAAGSNDRENYVAGAKPRPAYSPAGLTKAEALRLNQLLGEKKELEAKLKEATTFPMVYAGTFKEPEPTYRLYRGDPMQKREVVAPGGLGRVMPRLDLPGTTPEQERRLALARWIASPENPLTARVMVNRIWQHHFGQGLVNTPSDFGANGAQPTHPELLDWLATEFVAQGWRPKAIHRLILLSSTYRQTSAVNPNAMAVDASSRWLWRFPPRRLEAEPIRDSILRVSGKLDLKMGGPGYSVFEPNDNYVRVYNPKKEFGPLEWRRMIYQYKPRMQQDAVFGAFDCPDGAQIAPKRNSSTTPLQALNLLNDRFMLQQAGFFAERLQSEAGADAKVQVTRAFMLAFNREPAKAELSIATKLAGAHGLPAFCRALLNANEFMFVF